MARNATIAGHLAEHDELNEPELPDTEITGSKVVSILETPELSHGVGPIDDEEDEDPWAAPKCECVVDPGEVCRCRGVKKHPHE